MHISWQWATIVIATVVPMAQAQQSIGIVNGQAFPGPDQLSSGIGTGVGTDNAIAVGPNWVAIAMNRRITVYDRNSVPPFDVPMDGSKSLVDFFDLPGSGYDPRILYGQAAHRVVESTLGGA